MKEQQITEEQICIKCKNSKPLKNFSKKMSNANGYTKTCTGCIYERQKELKQKKKQGDWWDAYTIPKW